MIRIAIFDDHAKRRDSLSLLINSKKDMSCVGSFPDCRDVLRKVVACKPDVILMDIDMPHVDGVEGVTTIRQQFADVKILMQTVFEDNEKIFASIVAGADGYILKQTKPADLINGVREVIDGGAPMTPTIARKVLRLFNQKTAPGGAKEFNLTKRETEILALLVEGFSYKLIADKCNISYATVNTHVTRIYKKLQVSTVASAVKVAIKEGLV